MHPTVKAKLIQQLKIDEGFRTKEYRDSEGILTIGFGYNLEANPLKLHKEILQMMRASGISREYAGVLLEGCLNLAELDAIRSFPWYRGLSDNRKAAILNMLYNLGLRKFTGFKKTIGYLSKRLYKEAAIEMLDSKWARQVGNRAIRISQIIKYDIF
jgi:lysozyme